MSVAAPAPLVHRYEPRGAAVRLLECRDGEVLIAGSAGTGKTVACLHKIHLAALKYPKSRHLIVRKTALSLSSTTLVTWRERVAGEALDSRLIRFFGGSPQKPAAYQYKNGSEVVIGGMDKASKIMSSDYDLVYAGEATELVIDDWEAIITRLRHGGMPYSQAIADCNPDRDTHWLNLRAESGLITMLRSVHRDNPRYYHADGTLTAAGVDYIEGKLGRLTGVRRLRLLDGIWAAAEGLVYEEWDPAVHLVDAMPAGWESWPRYWVIDFGHTNPIVVQFWAEDPDGRLWMYREIYHTGQLVEDVAKQVKAIVAPGGKWIEPQPTAVICDHDAEDRATFERHAGVSTRAAKKDVSPGLQAVATRLRRAGDGRPRLFIVRDACVRRDRSLVEAGKPACTEHEFTGYVWKKGLDGKPVPEEPVKENDHGMDCVRYIVMERDWSSGSLFRGWLD